VNKRIWVLLAFLTLGFIVQPVRAQTQALVVLDVTGPIYPAVADYIERGLERAEDDSAEAVVLMLNTPGGDVATTLEIVQAIRNSRVPVVVYVTPPGAQAASAGSIITMAGHLSAMAPETVIGAASPVGGSGEDLDETIYRKVVEDLKATVRGLTESRPDAARTLAEAMVEEARAVSASEALDVGLIDIIATDLDDLLNQLDTRTVIVNNETVTLDTDRVLEIPVALTVLEQFQLAIANPILISLLLSLGSVALITEIRSPGGWVAGFVGVMCLGIAFLGLGQIPANWFGLGLILVAFILFVLEASQPGIGALALVGTLTLIGGFLVLFNTAETPEFARLPVAAAIGVSLPTAAFFLWLLTMAIRIQRAQPLSGQEGLPGQTAVARADFQARGAVYEGTVLLEGEIWRAQAAAAVAKDERVVVESVSGLTVSVKSAESIPVPTA
jgi:membrane-bound serine protease (ClpP class)